MLPCWVFLGLMGMFDSRRNSVPCLARPRLCMGVVWGGGGPAIAMVFVGLFLLVCISLHHGSWSLLTREDTVRYGKGLMKKHKCGPDAWIQMALQLAYYRDQVPLNLFPESVVKCILKCSLQLAYSRDQVPLESVS